MAATATKNATEFDNAVADVRTRAESVAKELRKTAGRAEELRRVPMENMEMLAGAGLLRVIQAKRSGGHELSMRAHLNATSAVAEGCSATGWVLGVVHAHSWILAHFPLEAQDDVYGKNPDTIVAAVVGPRGKAARQPDGSYKLNGFWPFGSGSQVSEWMLLGAEVLDDKGEVADIADFLVPSKSLEIKDDWHVAGLAGTGSCSVVAKDLVVPAHRYLSLLGLINHDTPGMKNYGGWLHKGEAVPVLSLCLCGSSLGLARRALKEFPDSVRGKNVAYTEHVYSEWSATHIQLGNAASLIRAAELLLYGAADDIDAYARDGKQMPMEMRGRMRMDCSQGVRFALEAVERLYINGSASGLMLRSATQQISRDLHAVNMHGLLLHDASAELYGRVLMGLEPNTIII